MEYLYVCHFSNGHIKVGRSIDPKSRIAAHAERVACLGVEMIEHHIAECTGRSAPAEQHLIKKCIDLSTGRNKSEWFSGLDYLEVCEIANTVASTHFLEVNTTEYRKGYFQNLLEELSDLGVTQKFIVNHCGVGQSTISSIAVGKTQEPAYSLGVKLVELLACTRKPAKAV